MKKIAYALTVFFAFTALPVFAEELPEIAPVEEAVLPALDVQGEPAAESASK